MSPSSSLGWVSCTLVSTHKDQRAACVRITLGPHPTRRPQASQLCLTDGTGEAVGRPGSSRLGPRAVSYGAWRHFLSPVQPGSCSSPS